MSELRVFDEPHFDEREALRYAGVRSDDAESKRLCLEALEEARPVLKYRVCYCELKLTIRGDLCDFGCFSVTSAALAAALCGARKVVLFLASVGHGIDALIRRYSKTSPARALMLGAIGSERVEALADEFTKSVADEYGMQPLKRFSPGYADLPLSLQGEVFRQLRPEAYTGAYLSESFFISPTKTVTAFLGLK